MMFKKLTVVALSVLSGIMVHATFPTLHFEHLNTSNGLSNNRVYDIFQDRQGFLWFATLDGLNRYDGYSFLTFKNIPGDSLSLQDNRILSIQEDAQGFLWLATRLNGLIRFDPQHQVFKHYTEIAHSDVPLKSLNIDVLKLDKENNLIAYDYHYKLKYDSVGDAFSIIEKGIFPPRQYLLLQKEIEDRFGLKVKVLHVVHEREFHWICTERNGLFIIKGNEKNEKLIHYEKPPFDNKVETKCIFKDNMGTLWISTKNRGVFKHNPQSRCFEHHNTFNIADKVIQDITVRAITEDFQKNIWIGTYNYGLLKYVRKENRYVQYLHKDNDPNSLPNNMIRSLYTDVNGKVWVGSYGGASCYDEQNDRFVNYLPKYGNEVPTEADDKEHLYFNRVYNFANDHFGNLWIANWEGLSKLNKQTQKFTHYPKSYFGVDNIRKVFVDRNNTVWVGCEYGGLIQLNPLTGTFTRYLPEDNATSLPHQNIFSVFEAKDGTLWVATFNGLSKLDRGSGSFTTYTNKDGLAGNMVYGILEDSQHRLWLTTVSGLSVFDPQEETFTNFTERRGLQGDEFTEGAFFESELTGEIIVGGTNGFNIFHPDSIAYNTRPPKIVLTQLKIFNETVPIGDNDGILSKDIPYTHNITLQHKDKIVSFEFSGLHYAIPEQNLYKYRLKGFDDKWVQVGHDRRFATYTNLPGGKYIFQVMAANSDGIWSRPVDALHVTMLPPLWKKWWAFCIYAFTIVLLLLAFRKYSLHSLQIKNQLKLERIKREKSDELHKMKLDFFTNVSHEFRTPLTLILSPLESLLKVASNAYIGNYKDKLKIISGNAQKLLRLTDQILDLRKLELGKVDIHAEETPLVLFAKHVTQNFKELAAHRGIDFQFVQPDTEIFVWIDRDKFEKIMYNLISNALKFSHDQSGKITVTISASPSIPDNTGFYTGKIPKGPFVSISVADNGIGIPNEVIKKIFQQFYRVDNSQTLSIQGSGIGLALVKELVDLHGGTILVDSAINVGSQFTILLPLGNSHLLSKQIKSATKGLTLEGADQFRTHQFMVFDGQFRKPFQHKESAPTVLVVEDNEELRTYICNLLGQTYNILEAPNGQVGLKSALENFPDLIISDIMMPIKNGIELCNAIKNDIRTSHIPVILLTAKTLDEHRIEGYQSRADDYVTKPFNTQILLLRVKNLLESRKQLQKLVRGEQKAPQSPGELKLSPLDKEFLDRVNTIITNNLSDFNFNVEALSKQIGMSRSNLHIKLKALTNQPASEYIRAQKLAYAEKILKEQLKSVSEVAYEAGFNTPSYFIKCFKEKYGITPKEYMGNLN